MFADLVEDLMGLDDALTERFRDVELRRRRDEAELAALVAVAEARAVYTADGHLTVQGGGCAPTPLVTGRSAHRPSPRPRAERSPEYR